MRDQETKGLQKAPNCERIAGQAYVWLDADKQRISNKGDEAKKKAAHELRKLAVVLDEERAR